MADLQWFEMHPPRGLDLAAVTALVRPLADRPRTGFGGGVPLVAFEVWNIGGQIRYLLGVDHRLARSVPVELAAQLPGLAFVLVRWTVRPVLRLAADVRLHGTTAPLRLDTASAVSAGLLARLREVDHSHEAAVVQWVLGPAHPRRARPTQFSVAVRELPGPTALPLGLHHMSARPPVVHEEALQPGDQLLAYADGVTDAVNDEGERFGVDRLIDLVGRALNDELPAPESMRRLVRAVVTHQFEGLQDDATAVLLQWQPPGHALAPRRRP